MSEAGRTSRDEDVGEVVDSLTAWTVAVVQYNEMVAARVGITPTDFQCLYALARFGPASPSELAHHVGLTSGSVSRMIDRLQHAGHVVRRPHERDRRRVIVEADPASLARVAELYRPLRDRLSARVADLADPELSAMLGFARDAERMTEEEIRALEAVPATPVRE
jgi:DNA-binding MarR family transcriptional regulator